jgi:chromosomal replication initiator protein
MDSIWHRCLEAIRSKLNDQALVTWLEPINCEEISREKLVLSGPNNFVISFVRDNYFNIIRETLLELTGTNYEIYFRSREEPLPKLADPQPSAPSSVQPVCEQLSVTDQYALRYNLSPRYTFDSFVVGGCNQFARAAALSVSENLGGNYNPLFIYGGVGLGKTHLMSAIGYQEVQRDKNLRVSFSTSEEFTNEMITAIRCDKMVDFRNKYRNMDLLMIDDIQFLRGKERTQEEFFHTFNRIYEMRKQIVLTADCFPNDLSDIEQRLQSRFSWGLVADIGPPDLETKVAILRRKAYEDRIDLSDEVAYYLARQVASNIRDLVGLLIRVVAMSTLQGMPLTLELAQVALKDMLRHQNKPVTIDGIISHVAKAFNVKAADIKSKKKHKLYSFPRQVGMYLARELTECSYPEIGAAFGGKDHSTVIYASKKIEKIIETDQSLKSMIEGIKREIRR